MTKVVSNKRQLRRLVELLQTHPEIARGISSKPSAQKKWAEFALDLNSLGPPEREWHKWQRVWADLKCKIKKKKTENDLEMSETGDRPIRLNHFSEMEEAVIEMLDLSTNTFATPNQETQLEDSLMSINESLVSVEDIKFDPADYSQEIMKNNAAQSPEDAKNNIFPIKTFQVQPHQTYDIKKVADNQTSAQKHFYENMTDLMRDIKRSVNNIEDHIKRDVQQTEELLEFKRQKLKLYKEKMKSERLDRKANLKLQAELLALKKRKHNGVNTKAK